MALDEAEIDALYAAPLDRFVAERTALAKRLRDEGRRDDAAEVRGLPKPGVSLWAANRLARGHGEEVRGLVSAAERLAKGDGAADADFRRMLRALAAEAPAALEAGGRKPTNAAVEGVVEVLRAAAADERARGRLLEGRLREEPEPAGFAAMAGARLAARPASRGKADDEARRRSKRRVAEAQEALAQAEARARDLRRAADDAERAAERARKEAQRAEADVERAERELAAAREPE